MNVLYEKLIVVAAPSGLEWWRELLRPQDVPFDDLMRFKAARSAGAAVQAVREARRHRLYPIVLCPDVRTREAVGRQLQEQVVPARLLVRGFDDARMRALLIAPSREALLVYARRREAVDSGSQYHLVIGQWIAASRNAQHFIRRVQSDDLDAAEFQVSSEESDAEDPEARFVIESQLDCQRRLVLQLDPYAGVARLIHLLDDQTRPGSLALADRDLRFDGSGRCALSREDLDAFAAEFDFAPAIVDWEARKTTVSEARDWLRHPREMLIALRGALRMPMLQPDQWRWVVERWRAESAALARGRTTSFEPGDAADLNVTLPQRPLRELRPELVSVERIGAAEARVLIDWIGTTDRRPAQPDVAPHIELRVDSTPRSAQLSWQGDFRSLLVTGAAIPHSYIYGWEWDAEGQSLRIDIEAADG